MIVAKHRLQCFSPLELVSSLLQKTLLVVPPLNYLFMHTREANAYCIGMFDNGGSGTLLGGITFRDILIQVRADAFLPSRFLRESCVRCKMFPSPSACVCPCHVILDQSGARDF